MKLGPCSPAEVQARFCITADGTLRHREQPQRTLGGSRHKDGIITFMFRGQTYNLARTTWCAYYGEWPTHALHHIDGNPRNNAVSNLELNLKCPIANFADTERERRVAASDTLWLAPRTKPLFGPSSYVQE